MIKLILFFLLSFSAFAGTMPNNEYKLGNGSSTSDKGFIFDTGDGASNPKLKVSDSGQLIYDKNTFKLGDGATANDKCIVLDASADSKVCWDGAEQKLVFNNGNGSTDKKFGTGSGSGGGENYNNAFTDTNNANAEEGTTGWTHSGGDFFTTASVSEWVTATSYSIGDKVVESGVIYKANAAHTSTTFASDVANWDTVVNADALEGSSSFVWIPSAQNDYVESSLLDVAKDIFKGKSCQSLVEYIGGDENLTLKVIDGNGDELSSQALITHGISGIESGWMLCPSKDAITSDSDKGNLKLRIENTGTSASPAIKFDKSYIGTNINLTEMVLSDVFSFDLDTSSDTVTNAENISITGCSNATAGQSDCTFIGLTSTPHITCTGTSDLRYVTFFSRTSSSFSLIARNESGTNSDTNLNCIGKKTGADAKQQIQIYKVAPTVAQFENKFSAFVNNSAVVSLENVSNWLSCTGSAATSKTCTFQTNLFAYAPNCNVTALATATPEGLANITSISSTTVVVHGVDAGTTGGLATGFFIECSRSTDHKTATVMPIFAGQVRNSYAESASKNMRVESCTIIGTSPYTMSSPWCSTWLDSISTAAELTINSSIFKTAPSCTCSANGGGNFSCNPNTSTATATFLDVDVNNSGDSTVGKEFNIICQGEGY